MAAHDSKPAEAARLFGVAHSIGASVLNLPGANLDAKGFRTSNSVALNVVLVRDEQSDRVERMQYEFLKAHPEHAQSARLCAMYEKRWAERRALNGESNGRAVTLPDGFSVQRPTVPAIG